MPCRSENLFSCHWFIWVVKSLKLIIFNGLLENCTYLVEFPENFPFLTTKRNMKKDTLEYRMMMEHNRLKIPDSKLLTGSLVGKHPIILDSGRTVIFITDLSKESEIRERYQLRRDSRLNLFAKKPKV